MHRAVVGVSQEFGRLANGIKDLVALLKNCRGTSQGLVLIRIWKSARELPYHASQLGNFVPGRRLSFGALQRLTHSMEAPGLEEAPAPKFVVQELAKWASASNVTMLRPTESMEVLNKSGISDGAKMEEDAILKEVPVWKSYYLLKMLPLT